MNYPSIRIEGAILSPDILERLEDAPGQQAADFGFDRNARVKDEIARAWADAQDYWRIFQRTLETLRPDSAATTETRQQWVVPLLDKFLVQRRPAIKQDLENIYKRFYPNTAMPSDSVDKVITLLRDRVKGATKDGLAPKITSTTISFRYSTNPREDPWSDAVLLLSKIAIRSRELVTDRYKPRELKIADVSVPDYLKAMDVMGDALVALALDKGWESPWVVERGREEMKALDAYGTSDDSGETRCQWLVDLIKGRKQRDG